VIAAVRTTRKTNVIWPDRRTAEYTSPARISYRTQEIAMHSKKCSLDTEDNRSVIKPERFTSNGRIRAYGVGNVLRVLWTVPIELGCCIWYLESHCVAVVM
jgi:hypothetical protein